MFRRLLFVVPLVVFSITARAQNVLPAAPRDSSAVLPPFHALDSLALRPSHPRLGAAIGAAAGLAAGLYATRDVSIGCKASATPGVPDCDPRQTEFRIRLGVSLASTALGALVGSVVGALIHD